MKHGKYSVIERDLAAAVRELQQSWYVLAASERNRFMRAMYQRIANAGVSAADLDKLRDAILEDRLDSTAIVV